MVVKDKIRNTLYGAIVADALGVPVEFKDRGYLKKNPVTDMTGYGTYNLPEGSWSDDSSLTLCLAESIGRLKEIDYDDIMRNFFAWFKYARYTPDHYVFDIGRTCYSAILRFRQGCDPLDCGLTDEKNNGNGSLMRISPLPFYLFRKYGSDAMYADESYKLIHNVSRLTHGHNISLTGCDIYCSVMMEILNGTKKEELLKTALLKIGEYVSNHPEYVPALEKYGRLMSISFPDLKEEDINSTGYVVDTLEAALWCFLNSESYRECVLKAVNLGRDTDTVASVAGSLAGLYYGGIPEKWIETIRNRKLVDKVIDGFSKAVEEQ